MGLPYHHPLITAPQREDEDNIAGELRKIMAGEVTPKGLYRRQGRVDERSEIYPV